MAPSNKFSSWVFSHDLCKLSNSPPSTEIIVSPVPYCLLTNKTCTSWVLYIGAPHTTKFVILDQETFLHDFLHVKYLTNAPLLSNRGMEGLIICHFAPQIRWFPRCNPNPCPSPRAHCPTCSRACPPKYPS